MLKKYSTLLYCVIPSLILLIFYKFYYWGMLHYAEQYQIFLKTKDFFIDHLLYPGGMMDYLGEFFTQFSFYQILGAFIMAVAFGLGTFLMHLFVSKIKPDYCKKWQILITLPMLATWGFLFNEIANFSFALAMIFAIAFAYGYTFVGKKWTLLLFVPIVYYLTCTGAYVFVALVLIWHFFQKKDNNFVLFAIISLFYVFVLPLISYYFTQLRFHNLYWGFHFCKNQIYHSPAEFVAIISIPLIAIVLYYIKGIKYQIIVTCAVCALALFYSYSNLRTLTNQVYKLDYYTKYRQWNQILSWDTNNFPKHDISIALRNLALAKEGKLLNDMFDVEQEGYQSLIPNWCSDYITAIPIAEIMYNISNVGTALRYYFECNSAIMDYKKSARCYRRMAEIAMLNNEFGVAEKYCHILQNTIYYRQFAEFLLELMKNPTQIPLHPQYQDVVKNRYKVDAIFNRTAINTMLCIMLDYSPDNYVAFEYLIAFNLLTKDLENFVKNLKYADHFNLNIPPKCIAQALTIVQFETKRNDIAVPETYKREFQEFYNFIYNHPMEEVIKKYKNTYYFHYYCKVVNNEIPPEL